MKDCAAGHRPIVGGMRLSFVILTAAWIAGFAAQALAQAPGVPVESADPRSNAALLEKLATLREAGKGLDVPAAKAALEKPSPEILPQLPAGRTTPLRPAEVWQAAQRSRLRVGWHYLCHKCDHWHVNLAGGYPVTADGVVATCFHVAEPGEEIREGRLVVVDAEGAVYPVTSVIARSRAMDACLLRAEGLKCEPLPLNDQVRPGDQAFLLSSPLGVEGYFTEGMVNRFFRTARKDRRGGTEKDQNDLLRMNVSTDWAPGSSGSPVLDVCGNAIGHVASISHLGEGKNSTGKSVAHLTLHEAIPARCIRILIADAAVDAARPPEPFTMDQLHAALEAGNFDRAAEIADALTKDMQEKSDGEGDIRDPGDENFETAHQLRWARLTIAAGQKREADAVSLAVALAEMHPDQGPLLNDIAWKLVTSFQPPSAATLTEAEKMARRSGEVLQHRDPAAADTLARVLFLQDKKEEAVKLQEEAVNLAEGDLKAALQKTLDAYREGKLP